MNIDVMIKQQRQAQKMSINMLAKKANISQSSLSRIEAGRNSPTFEVLERIITALGFSPSSFFSGNQPELEPDVQRLLELIKMLDRRQRQALENFLDCMKA